EVGLVTAPVLGPPDGERPLEDRARPRRIRVGDDRRIEERALRAGEDRSRDDYPLVGIAAAEVRVVRLPGEGVEPQLVVAHVEAGLPAVAVDDLRPDLRRAAELERAVVLGSALEQ